ncbi:MAG TPA: hypothetical protein VH413_16355 [Verrucomicrobiae bacterium]|nr:hypothetical protein [Verrucomicrobiae bacterium]
MNWRISQYKFSFQTEMQLQEEIAKMLTREGVPFLREFRLSDADRPDFVVSLVYPRLVALEVKIAGGVNGHLRQLRRYAESERIAGTFLLCPKPYPLPETLSGKPCACLPLWTSML